MKSVAWSQELCCFSTCLLIIIIWREQHTYNALQFAGLIFLSRNKLIIFNHFGFLKNIYAIVSIWAAGPATVLLWNLGESSELDWPVCAASFSFSFPFCCFYLPLGLYMKLYLYTFEILFFPRPQLSLMFKLFMVYCKYAEKRTYPDPAAHARTQQQHSAKSVFIKWMFVFDFETAAIQVILILV